MSSAGISVVLILSVIFIVILLDALMSNHRKRIVTHTNNKENIELELRRLLHKNADSEIYIINNKDDAESRKIIELLCRDFPQIRIINKKTEHE